MKPEVGKRYVRRDGSECVVLLTSDPFDSESEEQVLTLSEDYCYDWLRSDGQSQEALDSGNDIVAEAPQRFTRYIRLRDDGMIFLTPEGHTVSTEKVIGKMEIQLSGNDATRITLP